MLSKPGALTIRVYDTTGGLVQMLAHQSLVAAGRHTLTIAGPDLEGRMLSAGIDHYRIDAPPGVRTGRFAIVR